MYDELIEKLRILQNKNSLSLYKREVCRDAADTLEAADKRIAELERNFSDACNANGSLTCERNELLNDVRELEAQLPKEGEWKKILQNDDGTSDYECSACLGIIENVPDDDEHPLCSFCPLCGAKMKRAVEFDKCVRDGKRPSWCPIKGVLPDEHGDLIDRDILLQTFQNADYETYNDYCEAFDTVEAAETVIAAERKDDEQIH